MKLDDTKINLNKWNAINVVDSMVKGDFNTSLFECRSDWVILSRVPEIPEFIIEKYIHKFDWRTICKYQKLSEDFIEKHIDLCRKDTPSFAIISTYQDLSDDFIRRHCDELSWASLYAYGKLSDDMKQEFHHKIAVYEDIMDEGAFTNETN